MRYIPHTEADVRAMLATIGVPSIDALFEAIPAALQLGRALDVPSQMAEPDLRQHLRELAEANVPMSRAVSFLGGGTYRHYAPVAVSQLLLRGEIYTAYTPYQPEIAQGTLQALYEFQTQVCALTGMDVANASLYDGSSAALEGVLMAARITGRKRAVLSGGLHPHYAQTIQTLGAAAGVTVDALPLEIDNEAGVIAALSDDVACVVVQTPNLFGTATDITAIAEAAHAAGALLICVTPEALALALLKSPGEMGADIVAAEGAGLAGGLNFGGPYLGLFAARQKFLRQMPGRLCGETVDAEGRRGFVLTLSTREQHIRREKATSNVCTNSGLVALAFTIHMTLLGQTGLTKLAKLNHAKARRLAKAVGAVAGVEVLTPRYFNEIAVRLPAAAAPVVEQLAQRGILAGVPVSRLSGGFDDVLLLAATETCTDGDIAALAAALTEIL